MAKGDFIGEFELYVLLALVHLEDQAYGLKIRQLIEERTGRHVAIGAVYATLGRLTDKGLIDFTMTEPQPVQGGRSRKVYRLSPAGRRALEHSATMLSRMLAGSRLPGAGKVR